jgi:YesN/AraC family two-component response regulator
MGNSNKICVAVLIVEDESLIRMGTVLSLEDDGFLIYEAGNAEKAVSMLEEHAEIRLVFTDINMPGSMDGLKLAHYAQRRRPPYTVLIVDDSKLARMAVIKTLAAVQPNWGWVEAKNANEAIALASQTAVDIALLDVNMPGRDGLQLAAELLVIRPDLEVAFISANQQREIVGRARALNAEFLPKPLVAESLRAFLDEVVLRKSRPLGDAQKPA